MALRQALLVDQVDGCNMLSIEIQFRRLQTIEFSYSKKARELEAKAVGFSTLMICPDLLDHVKSETEKEASLART